MQLKTSHVWLIRLNGHLTGFKGHACFFWQIWSWHFLHIECTMDVRIMLKFIAVVECSFSFLICDLALFNQRSLLWLNVPFHSCFSDLQFLFFCRKTSCFCLCGRNFFLREVLFLICTRSSCYLS